MPDNLRDIYLLRVSINDVDPPIWRTIRVQSVVDLWQLHIILQVSIGWTNSHLHQFTCDGKVYGTPDPDFGEDVFDEHQTSLRSILKEPGDSLSYFYDFGDGWEHTVVLKEILPYSHDIAFPTCVAAERNCPPEDVGGPFGYQEFLEAFSNPHHPEHSNMVEWAGEDFEPNIFDTCAINEFLKSWESSA